MPHQPHSIQHQISYSKVAEQNLNAIMDDDDDDDDVYYQNSSNRMKRSAVAARGGYNNSKKNDNVNSNILQRTVYVADLSPNHTDLDVSKVFSRQYGVTKVTKQIGTTFAYVAFQSVDSVRAVLKQILFYINGHPIRCMPYNPPTEFCNPEANLIVKNLESYVNELHLLTKFGRFGEILSTKVVRDAENKSKCFAYVQFKTVESAEAAIDALNNTYWEEEYDPDKLQFINAKNKSSNKALISGEEEVIKGKKIYVGVFKRRDDYYKEKEEKEGRESNLYVKNLGPNFGDRDLYALFKAYGVIKSAKIRRDKITNRPMGCGFVDFENPDHADRALEALNGHVLGAFGGRVITVKYASCKSRRQRRKEEAQQLQLQQKQLEEEQTMMIDNNDAFSTSGLSDTMTSYDGAITTTPTPPPQIVPQLTTDFNNNNLLHNWFQSSFIRPDYKEYKLFE